MRKIKKGDLIYVPSQVNLYNKDESGSITDYIILERPTNLLVTDIREAVFEVVRNNKKWLVNKKNVYGVSG